MVMPLELEWGEFCAHGVFATVQRECHERHHMAEEARARSSAGTPGEWHADIKATPTHNRMPTVRIFR